jgi:carbamoyltransferase
MWILGITNNDLSGAAIVEDDRIIAAVSEERFTRIKDYKGWPANSIEFVLSEAGISLFDIDRIGYGWSRGFDPSRHLDLYLDRAAEFNSTELDEFKIFKNRIFAEFRNDLAPRNEVLKWARSEGVSDQLTLLDHHECHAYGAFCMSPFTDALVVTCDGRGDFQSLTISSFINGTQQILHRETSSDSLGYFYGRITNLLGFRANRHEGKVLGLAGYGKPSDATALMEKMITFNERGIRAHLGKYFVPFYDHISDELYEEFTKFSKEDIAYAAQTHLESILTQLVGHYARKTGLSKLCVAGGIFANVKLNRSLAELESIDDLFVLPCMGDGGLALGAAVAIPYLENGIRAQLHSMRLGPSFSDYYPELYLIDEPNNFQACDYSSVEEVVMEMYSTLLDFRVIGVVRGRAEFGPRALCNRSILCRPDIPEINDVLNARLKRSEFMPFAPVVAVELAERCFQSWAPNHTCTNYMTRTYSVTNLFRGRCPGAVHIDGTARPQIVRSEDDPTIHALLIKLYQEVGVPALINTSFNTHEEPIINGPKEAVSALSNGQVDALFINDRWKLLCKSEVLDSVQYIERYAAVPASVI